MRRDRRRGFHTRAGHSGAPELLVIAFVLGIVAVAAAGWGARTGTAWIRWAGGGIGIAALIAFGLSVCQACQFRNLRKK